MFLENKDLMYLGFYKIHQDWAHMPAILDLITEGQEEFAITTTTPDGKSVVTMLFSVKLVGGSYRLSHTDLVAEYGVVAFEDNEEGWCDMCEHIEYMLQDFRHEECELWCKLIDTKLLDGEMVACDASIKYTNPSQMNKKLYL